VVGPLPAGRPWTGTEEQQLLALLAANVKTETIARKLKRSRGAIYARIKALKNATASSRSLPSQRLARAREQMSQPKQP